MLYFTADEHFDSLRACELSRRPFFELAENGKRDWKVADMNEAIINNLNKVVKPDDLVIHVGDFGNFDYLKRLNGKHAIVLGNYETDEMNGDFGGDFDKYKKYLHEKGFHLVFEKSAILSRKKIYITHKPSDRSENYFNLYAHIHGRHTIRRNGFDVGVDAHHFYPVSMNDVEFYRTAIEKHYDNDVFDE